MTERWRKKLRDLDSAAPTNEVYDRAKKGPTRVDEPLPDRSARTRVVTGVVAFALFALALSAFAIPAFRLGDASVGDKGLGMFPLWPAQDPQALSDLQARADAGNADWLLDPSKVAIRFGSDVLRWERTQVEPLSSKYCSPNQVIVEPNWAGSSRASDAPVACASPVVPTPDAAAPTPVQGAFPVLSLMNCAGDLCTGGGQVVQLFQPLEQGPSGIWAILSAMSSQMPLSVAPGQTVHDGSTISASVPSGDLIPFVPTLAYASCGSTGAISADAANYTVGATDLSLKVKLAATAGCTGQQRGYVWVAEAQTSLASESKTINSDPLQGAAGSVSFLSAVPIVAMFPADQAVSTTSSSQSPTSDLVWTTFSDPLGWSIDVPSDWSDRAVDAGQLFSGSDLSVQINRSSVSQIRDDSAFPLDAEQVLSPIEGGLTGYFTAGGIQFTVTVMTPYPPGDLPSEQRTIVRHMIRSISLEPWQVGETRNGLTAVGKAVRYASAQWVGDGQHFLTFDPGDGGRYAFGPPPDCGANASPTYEVRESGSAGVSCADGTGGDWAFDTGEPLPGNSARFTDPLPQYPAAYSWDGYLLVRFTAVEQTPTPTPS